MGMYDFKLNISKFFSCCVALITLIAFTPAQAFGDEKIAEQSPKPAAASVDKIIPKTSVSTDSFRLTPSPGKVVRRSRPVVKVRYPKELHMRYATARLWVNGHEVSSHCLRTPNYISYQPFTDMTAGQVSVRFKGRCLENADYPIELDWTFDLHSPELITSADHNAARGMIIEDKLVVRAEGVAGATAWFSIENIADKVAMQELSPGMYEGTYTTKLSDKKLGASITVYMRHGSNQSSKVIEKKVSFAGGMFVIIIDSPKPDEEVPLQFVIKGHTKPYAKVHMFPSIGMGEHLTTRDDRYSSSVVPVTATADEHGNFTMDYSFPVLLPDMTALFSFTARDRDDREAIPHKMWVKFK